MWPVWKFDCYFANLWFDHWHLKEERPDNYTQEISATGRSTVCDRGLAHGIRFFIFLGASSLCRLVLLEHFTLTFLISVSRSNYSVIREAKELLAWVHINYCGLCTLEYKVAKYMLERPEFSSPGPIFLQIHSSSLTHFSFTIDFTFFFLQLNNPTSSIIQYKWHFLSEQIHSQPSAKLNIQTATSSKLKRQSQTSSIATYCAKYFDRHQSHQVCIIPCM